MRQDESHNLAARAGRWSARRRGRVMVGWIAFVVVALALGAATGTETLDDDDFGSGESSRAEKARHAAFPEHARENVLIQRRDRRVTDPDFRAVVADVLRRLGQAPHVRDLESPYEHAGRISRDGRSALVGFDIPGGSKQAEERVAEPVGVVDRLQEAHPGFRVEQFGDASLARALGETHSEDMRKAELLSLPIIIVILVLVFGALVAAVIPLLLGVTSVAATLGLLGPISQISPTMQFIASIVLIIGLAVGIDYSMFYLRREREERARGRSAEAALRTAAATSGRAVLISGLTVMIAMAGMYFAGAAGFAAISTGTILVVAIAVVGSVTVLPAVLSKLGDRVNKARVPLLTPPEQRAARASRLWSAVLDRVLRRPLGAALAAAALLVVLAVPLLNLHTAIAGVEGYPRSLEVRETYDRMQRAFPGGPAPAEVVVQARDVNAPPVAAAIRQLRARASRSDLLERPVTVRVSSDRSVALASIPLAGGGTDARSMAALAELRDRLIPATLGRVRGVSADVTGHTAQSKDITDVMQSRLPLVVAFVLGLAFLLLMVTFRSIVIPLKAIVLNLLSVGASLGIVTWVFQEGHGESLLGFQSTGAITPFLPVFLFVILFGLSMDYHVFILSRVREAYLEGMSTPDAVSHAIRASAPVVTAAAVVMVAVFGIFLTLSDVESKQYGLGLALAILIDATLIRGVLLPAMMTLLGEWNWYLPRALRWLPEPGRTTGPIHQTRQI